MPHDHFFKNRDEAFHWIDWGGSGLLVHIAHATGFCARTYAPLAERLRSQFRVVGMDDRGHGQTRAAADPRRLFDWDPFTDDLEAFFESLHEPVIAMGHSRGGVASLLLAVRRPDLVRALILMDPTILPLSWMGWWFLAKKTGLAKRIPIAARAARRKALWPNRTTLADAYRRSKAFSSWQPGFLDGYIEDGTVVQPDGTVALTCHPLWESRCFAVCPHDVWRYIPRLQQPTLVLYGKDSDTFLRAAVERFERVLPHTVVHGLEDTSHFVPMERPEEVTEFVVSFVEAIG